MKELTNGIRCLLASRDSGEVAMIHVSIRLLKEWESTSPAGFPTMSPKWKFTLQRPRSLGSWSGPGLILPWWMLWWRVCPYSNALQCFGSLTPRFGYAASWVSADGTSTRRYGLRVRPMVSALLYINKMSSILVRWLHTISIVGVPLQPCPCVVT